MNKWENKIRNFLNDIDEKGYLKHRESSTIEFKENFNFNSMAKYARTMAAFANNKGGIIIFGIKDSPRIIVGIDGKKFNEIKQEKITSFLTEHFYPEIKWDIGVLSVQNKHIGYLAVLESDNKPIICRKKSSDIKSGEIYYRYRGQTKKIEYSELKKIIDEYREKERKYWMKHIERIAKIGPQNIALVDILNGDIHTGTLENAQILMDRNLLEELKENVKFIEEGKFTEKEGAPALKLIGEIKAVNGYIVPNMNPNKDYPYLQKQLAEELGIKPYYVQVLIWKLGIKNEKKYHIEIDSTTNKRSKVHKYSKYALEKLREHLNQIDNSILRKYIKEYQNRNKK